MIRPDPTKILNPDPDPTISGSSTLVVIPGGWLRVSVRPVGLRLMKLILKYTFDLGFIFAWGREAGQGGGRVGNR